MSAMPARTPRVAPTVRVSPPRKPVAKRPKKTQNQWKKVIVPAFSPVLETLTDSIPTPRSSRRAFSYTIAGLILAGLLLLGFVNTMTASASFEKHDLTVKLSQLTATQQQLQAQVALQESPGQLINIARKLGMVPAASPAFIRLSDHKILGKPELATKGH